MSVEDFFVVIISLKLRLRLRIAVFATTSKTSYRYLEQVLRRDFSVCYSVRRERLFVNSEHQVAKLRFKTLSKYRQEVLSLVVKTAMCKRSLNLLDFEQSCYSN